jgi:polar amino acid transport system substrate-binding protein
LLSSISQRSGEQSILLAIDVMTTHRDSRPIFPGRFISLWNTIIPRISSIPNMRAALHLFFIAMLLAPDYASCACMPVRLGYVNQHRPPYFLGADSVEPRAPGATVELIRDIAAAAGCAVVSVRLPPLRLRLALGSGEIDAMLMDAVDSDLADFALPQLSSGKLDADRAMRMYTVVFVRARDMIPSDTDPRVYFASRRLGTNNGASLAAQLRKQGFTIDDGGHDGPRNLEKLARGRIDGYAATMVSPTRMDAYIAARFGKQLLRLEQPLRIHHFWLGFSKRYYERNRTQVEAMWNWMGAHGHARFVELVEQYEKTP